MNKEYLGKDSNGTKVYVPKEVKKQIDKATKLVIGIIVIIILIWGLWCLSWLI